MTMVPNQLTCDTQIIAIENTHSEIHAPVMHHETEPHPDVDRLNITFQVNAREVLSCCPSCPNTNLLSQSPQNKTVQLLIDSDITLANYVVLLDHFLSNDVYL